MIEKTITLYEFDELDDRAKEKARDWWREGEAQSFTIDYDDFTNIAKIFGIEFKQNPVQTWSGKTRHEPAIYWGLHTQGSGASFEGTYRYAKGCSKAIREYAPMDEKLHQIADGLTAFQKKYFYRVIAKITVDSGYVHQYGMEIETYDTEWDWFSLPDEDRKALRDLLRDFAGWMYKQIDAEWDSRMSEENVDEVIRGNDYTFTASGKRSNGNG